MKTATLTNRQREQLIKLTEECAEVMQCARKILLHGYESKHGEKTNRQKLEDELGDVRFWTLMLCGSGDIIFQHILDRADTKYPEAMNNTYYQRDSKL